MKLVVLGVAVTAALIAMIALAVFGWPSPAHCDPSTALPWIKC